MFQFIANKIRNKKLLNASLLSGTVLLTAFLAIYPMFREGSLNRLLQTLFVEQNRQENQFPAVIRSQETIDYSAFSSVQNTEERLHAKSEEWCSTLQARPVQEQMIFGYHGGSASTRFGSKSTVVNLGYIPNLYDYVDVVYGTAADQAQFAQSEFVKEAIANGAVPCVISQKTMDDNNLVVGDLLSFKYRIYDDSAPELDFVITGIIEEKEADDFFWHDRLASCERTLFLEEDDFDRICRDNEIGEITVGVSKLIDYTKIDHQNAQTYLTYLLQAEQKDETISDNFSSLLHSYAEQEREISMILFTFEIPIVALLLLFLYMVSGRILEMETTEIAMLKSRGVSRGRIIGIYAAQS